MIKRFLSRIKSVLRRDGMNGENTFAKAMSRPFVALAIIAGNFAILYIVFSGQCPIEWQGYVDKTTGALQTLLAMIVTFYFGSSSGSEIKTGIMAKTIESREQIK
jgi:hypothetical protein